VRTLLRLLVRLFPPSFRSRFGAAIVEHAAHDCERDRARGRGAVLRSFLLTAFDIGRSAFSERLHPSWAGVPLEKEGTAVRSTFNLDGWGAELRHALRTLKRTPAFTATVVGTLALAIGTIAAVFTVLDRVVISPLPYAHPERLVFIAAQAPGSEMKGEFGVAAEFYLQYKETSRLLEDAAIYATFTNSVRVGDRVERVRMAAVTNSLYSTLGAQPALGRLPVAADEDRVVVISDALWRSWFGADPAVLGRNYDIGGASRTIVGVMRPEFQFPNDGSLLWVVAQVRAEGLRPGRFGYNVVGRMAPGTDREAVAAELTTLARRLPERFGGSPGYARLIAQHRAVVRPLLDEMLGSAARSLWILFAAAAIVLLIACVNVANLFMVRVEARHRDLAVRRAIGASRAQLVRLQMAEALVAALLGGALAVLLAGLTLPVLLRAAPTGIPRLAQVSLSGRTLLFTLLAALVSGILCGGVAALRGASPNLARLREGGRGSTRRRRFGRDGLVAAQTAMALVLLIGAGLLMRSFVALRSVDPGYDTRDVFTFQFAPEQPALKDGPSWAQFHLHFLDRLAALPGVTSVGIVENVPLDEGTRNDRFRSEDMPEGPDAGRPLDWTFAAGDYFKAMAIDLVDGRPFETADHVSVHGNVVISRTAAAQLFPGQRAVGRRLQQQGQATWHTVVGVVEDVMQYGFRDKPQALVYFPLVGPTPTSWAITTPAYVIKTARADTIAPEVRALIREVAPEAPMYRAYTMAGLAARSMVALSFTLITLGVVSGLALFLGALGLYGVLSVVVAERTREIGVRMALGATAAPVRRMVVAQGARVVALGVAIGLLTAFGATRALSGLLFGVAAFDGPTFAAMASLMLVIGGLAAYLPARRASRVDPCESLRSD
jgi:putative ABC transport system permease protein